MAAAPITVQVHIPDDVTLPISQPIADDGDSVKALMESIFKVCQAQQKCASEETATAAARAVSQRCYGRLCMATGVIATIACGALSYFHPDDATDGWSKTTGPYWLAGAVGSLLLSTGGCCYSRRPTPTAKTTPHLDRLFKDEGFRKYTAETYREMSPEEKAKYKSSIIYYVHQATEINRLYTLFTQANMAKGQPQSPTGHLRRGSDFKLAGAVVKGAN